MSRRPARLAAALHGERGLSAPAEDGYYPGKGDPRVDVPRYDLRLRWRPAG